MALQRPHAQRGETLLEFAFASILFFMFLFGIVEFGLTIWQYNTLAHLSQDGARWASVHGHTSSFGSATTAGDVRNYVRSRAATTGTVDVDTTSSNASTKVCGGSAVDPGTLNAGDGVCVTVSLDLTSLTRLVTLPTLHIFSRSQMVIAR